MIDWEAVKALADAAMVDTNAALTDEPANASAHIADAIANLQRVMTLLEEED